MSGPKSSQYTLSAAQRAALEAELRRIREEAIRKEKVNGCISKINAINGRVKAEIEKAYKAIERIEMIKGEKCSNERDLCQKIIEELSKGHSLDVANSSIDNAESEVKRFEMLLSRMTDIKAVIIAECSKVEVAKREEIAKALDIGFSLSFSQISKTEAVENTEFFEKVARVIAEIDEFQLSNELKAEYERISLKSNEITDGKFLENFYAISIYPFYEKCKKYNEERKKAEESLEELIIIYNCLCRELGIVPEQFNIYQLDYSYVDACIEKMEEQRNISAEEIYIQKCIDDVMTEMGYDLCGNREITKKSGRLIKNELYHFDEGCAVNVTYQGNGQITMELGGVDTKNRIPSKEESDKLVHDMEEFCEDYKEIEERLHEKGIWTNHISILPPVQEYAQIINVSDYEMNRRLESLSIKNEERKKKKKSVQVLKKYGE